MSLKLKTLVIIENSDGSVTPTVYPDTQDGLKEAQSDFIKTAKENGVDEDIDFNLDPKNTDSIANVSDPENHWDLIMVRSQS